MWETHLHSPTDPYKKWEAVKIYAACISTDWQWPNSVVFRQCQTRDIGHFRSAWHVHKLLLASFPRAWSPSDRNTRHASSQTNIAWSLSLTTNDDNDTQLPTAPLPIVIIRIESQWESRQGTSIYIEVDQRPRRQSASFEIPEYHRWNFQTQSTRSN